MKYRTNYLFPFLNSLRMKLEKKITSETAPKAPDIKNIFLKSRELPKVIECFNWAITEYYQIIHKQPRV
jgi:hypothetical protein